MDTLLEPFEYAFFRNGIAVATLAGALCGLVGVYVVLRGMSYIGHGLSHAIFGGAIASYALGFSFYLGAGVWGLVSAVLILMIARRRSIGADAAIGVVTTASFAVGIVIISIPGSFTQNVESVLFGNVLGVSTEDVLIVAAVTVAAGATVFLRYRQLLFTTFDPEVADVSGVSTARMDITLALLLTALITVCMSVLGVTLIAAMLVVPPVIGRLLTDSFHKMLWISVGVGTFCGFVGVYLSYYLDWASGPAVVLTAAALFVVAYAVSAARRRALPEAALDAHVE
ncbi:MAG TPA: metal ABC transporter permease [Actinomycetota bacterium]|jgi:manganese/iron transport system permease protein/iron/zinc/copper transport system permease protein|nr:metal ABC transporter permease [Actinomycetota bacterium]